MTNKETRELIERVAKALGRKVESVKYGMSYQETIVELVEVIENDRANK